MAGMDTAPTAAVSAAVFTYIKTGEEAAYAASQAAVETEASSPATTGTATLANMWGVSGRSDQMQMRSMMQMRAFK